MGRRAEEADGARTERFSTHVLTGPHHYYYSLAC